MSGRRFTLHYRLEIQPEAVRLFYEEGKARPQTSPAL